MQYNIFLRILLKSNKKMKYLDTHDSIYLKYLFGLECETVFICLQGFWRNRRHDSKLGNQKFCELYLFYS
jgi:hypothetical protein